MESHNKGKKHQRLLGLRDAKEKTAKRSVYVRNFETSGTIEEDLNHFFSCYGDVKNVFVDKEQVWLQSDSFSVISQNVCKMFL